MILYHTGCPLCKLVERELKLLHLDYEECTDVDEMLKKGFNTVPILEDKDVFYYGAKNILSYLKKEEKN